MFAAVGLFLRGDLLTVVLLVLLSSVGEAKCHASKKMSSCRFSTYMLELSPCSSSKLLS